LLLLTNSLLMKSPNGCVHFLPLGAASSTSILELLPCCVFLLVVVAVAKHRQVLPKTTTLPGWCPTAQLNRFQAHETRGGRAVILSAFASATPHSPRCLLQVTEWLHQSGVTGLFCLFKKSLAVILLDWDGQP
jgi:hypothetical protein